MFILWGASARRKKALIDTSRHVVIESPHPSPLSASSGFFGSRPFSRANAALVEAGRDPDRLVVARDLVIGARPSGLRAVSRPAGLGERGRGPERALHVLGPRGHVGRGRQAQRGQLLGHRVVAQLEGHALAADQHL